MNILLIYPSTPGTFWNFKHILKFISRKAVFPPLGLLTVAALLPSDWNKRLIDMNVAELKDSDIDWADIVMISAMIIQRSSTDEVIARCRLRAKIILAGGPLFSARPEEFPDVDAIFINEGEDTIPKFISDWKAGHVAKIYKSNDWPNITKAPIPMWSLIRLKDYLTITVQFSRGCPFNCEFCDIIIMNGNKSRTKTPEQFVGELESLLQAGWRGSIFIADDNLIGNKIQVKAMLRQLIIWQKKHRYPFRFMTQTSVNLAADEELMNLMSAANFGKVFLGIESPNDNSLQECGKTQNIRNNVADAVKTIHQHGMQVMGGFIIGFDHDPLNIFELQKNFIENIGVVVAMLGLLTALPGTKLFNRLRLENRLTADSTGGNTDAFLNFIPVMNKEFMIKEYKKLMQTLYSAKSYYGRINEFLRYYKPTVKGSRLKFNDLKAFIKSLVIIGVFSRASVYYWRLILKTTLLRPRTLPVAVELAIQGHHLRKMALKL